MTTAAAATTTAPATIDPLTAISLCTTQQGPALKARWSLFFLHHTTALFRSFAVACIPSLIYEEF
jgi:hypothetical protein